MNSFDFLVLDLLPRSESNPETGPERAMYSQMENGKFGGGS